MNRNTTLLLAASWMAGAIAAAAADAKDELIQAAKALAEKPNYSWVATVVVPEDAQFKPGPTEGKSEKDGYLMVSQSFGPSTMEIVKKGQQAAITNPDGAWETLEEAENAEGFGRFRAVLARNLMAPAEDVIDMVEYMEEVQKEGPMYSGVLNEQGAKGMVSFRGRRGGGNNAGGPSIPFAEASAKFWVQDGVLSKMEVKVDGTLDFNGNEIPIVRTTTTEIKAIGSTRIQVPEGASAKLK